MVACVMPMLGKILAVAPLPGLDKTKLGSRPAQPATSQMGCLLRFLADWYKLVLVCQVASRPAAQVRSTVPRPFWQLPSHELRRGCAAWPGQDPATPEEGDQGRARSLLHPFIHCISLLTPGFAGAEKNRSRRIVAVVQGCTCVKTCLEES